MSRFSICLCWYTRLSHNNTGGCARIPLYVCVSVCKCVCMLFYICDLRDVPRDSLNMSRGISASPQVRFLSWKLVTVFVLINMSRGISASPQVWALNSSGLWIRHPQISFTSHSMWLSERSSQKVLAWTTGFKPRTWADNSSKTPLWENSGREPCGCVSVCLCILCCDPSGCPSWFS